MLIYLKDNNPKIARELRQKNQIVYMPAENGNHCTKKILNAYDFDVIVSDNAIEQEQSCGVLTTKQILGMLK